MQLHAIPQQPSLEPALREALEDEGPLYTIFKETVHAHPATVDGRCHLPAEGLKFHRDFRELERQGLRWCRICFGKD